MNKTQHKNTEPNNIDQKCYQRNGTKHKAQKHNLKAQHKNTAQIHTSTTQPKNTTLKHKPKTQNKNTTQTHGLKTQPINTAQKTQHKNTEKIIKMAQEE